MPSTREKDRQAIWILIGCAVVLGLVVALGVAVEQSTPRLDPLTLEAIGRPSTGAVSVLLDLTDPLTATQQRRLEARLRELVVRGLRDNDFLSIWQLGSTDEGSLRRLFAQYFPGREANPLWANPDRVAARSDSLFWAPMLATLRSLTATPRSDHSTILSALCELADQADFSSSKLRREVLFVSDLRENSTVANFYRFRPDFTKLRATSLYPSVRANLRGVTVDVVYLTRPGETPAAAEELRQFWKAYFSDCGATVVRFERL